MTTLTLNDSTAPLQKVGLGLLIVSPWINPYAAGPSPTVWPWLISAFCAVLLWARYRDLRADSVALSWLFAATTSSVLALIQYFGAAAELAPWVNQAKAGEAFANLRQRNHLATLISIGLISLIVLISSRKVAYKGLSGATLVALLLAGAAVATGSRTGLLQWVLVSVCAGWILRRRRELLAFCVMTLFGYGLLLVLMPMLLFRVTGLSADVVLLRFAEQSGCRSRTVLWSNVSELIGQRPWLGWGWGELDYAHFITVYSGPRFCDILDNAHNLPLHLAVELGIPVAVAIFVVLGMIVFWRKPWRDESPSQQLGWGVLAVIMLHSLLEYPLWYGPFQIAFGLACWLVCMPAQGHPAVQLAVSGWIRNAIMVTAMTGLLGAGFCYWRVSQIYLTDEARHSAYRDDTLQKLRDTPIFRNQLRFAELAITPVEKANAPAMLELGKAMLHYSPEPRVIEKLLESAALLGREDEAVFYLTRYSAAFPVEYARWAEAQKSVLK